MRVESSFNQRGETGHSCSARQMKIGSRWSIVPNAPLQKRHLESGPTPAQLNMLARCRVTLSYACAQLKDLLESGTGSVFVVVGTAINIFIFGGFTDDKPVLHNLTSVVFTIPVVCYVGVQLLRVSFRVIQLVVNGQRERLEKYKAILQQQIKRLQDRTGKEGKQLEDAYLQVVSIDATVDRHVGLTSSEAEVEDYLQNKMEQSRATIRQKEDKAFRNRSQNGNPYLRSPEEYLAQSLYSHLDGPAAGVLGRRGEQASKSSRQMNWFQAHDAHWQLAAHEATGTIHPKAQELRANLDRQSGGICTEMKKMSSYQHWLDTHRSYALLKQSAKEEWKLVVESEKLLSTNSRTSHLGSLLRPVRDLYIWGVDFYESAMRGGVRNSVK